MEKWKQVPGFGGHYEASSLGRLRVKDRIVSKRHKSGKMCRQLYKSRVFDGDLSNGYLVVKIGWDHNTFPIRIHRAVALAWHGEPNDPDAVCRHLDGNKLNNAPHNLAWGDHFDNMQDRKRHGRYPTGEGHHMNKFSDQFLKECAVLPVAAAVQKGISKSQYYRARRRFPEMRIV